MNRRLSVALQAADADLNIARTHWIQKKIGFGQPAETALAFEASPYPEMCHVGPGEFF
jgi:hypothetical protein